MTAGQLVHTVFKHNRTNDRPGLDFSAKGGSIREGDRDTVVGDLNAGLSQDRPHQAELEQQDQDKEGVSDSHDGPRLQTVCEEYPIGLYIPPPFPAESFGNEEPSRRMVTLGMGVARRLTPTDHPPGQTLTS